jgi:hypothetical protein
MSLVSKKYRFLTLIKDKKRIFLCFMKRRRNHFFALAATSLASCDFFLLALFLWIVPPLTALSSREDISE